MLFDTAGHPFEREIIMLNVRWYLSYKLSYRNLEEMALDRGLEVDHTTIYRWVIKFSPDVEEAVRKNKNPVGSSWRMDETYIKVKSKWKYWYRAVDKEGSTVDYLLTAKRDKKAGLRTKSAHSITPPFSTLPTDGSGIVIMGCSVIFTTPIGHPPKIEELESFLALALGRPIPTCFNM